MFYDVVQRQNPMNREIYGKFYARMITADKIGLRRLAAEISQMCTLSTPDIYAVFEALIQKLPEHLMSGHTVQLGEFGIMKLSVSSNGRDKADDVCARDITRMKILFRPGKILKKELGNAKFIKK